MYVPILACLMLTFCSLYGEPRILELLPNLATPLAVEPAIPENFVALSPSGELNPIDWIYWGPEEVLKAYFENNDSLERPLLRVKFSANLAQTGPDSFSDEESFKSLPTRKLKWGDYPVRAVSTQIQGTDISMAWVGLNDPQAGWTLMFQLIHKGPPNAEDLKFWDDFLTQTKQLKDWEFFKAMGQDLQEGYTIVNLGGAKVKMIAEKRARDGKMQVAVIPEQPDTRFEFKEMGEGAMAAPWRHGDPMVKVMGDIHFKKGNAEFTVPYATSIFYKVVTEFTFSSDEANPPQLIQGSY